MGVQVLEPCHMAKKKPARPAPSGEASRARIDLRAEPALVARLERQADRLGISVSAYIRQTMTRQLEKDETEEARLLGESE